ncbi:mycofactocin-coupled SDR family oxidoreductase [Gordonia neofelifaecis]|uniref:3-oxoacyl-[acyl-carrier-protein] reductase MabA n=1 Tax=Gordonia neofelifaecis NRRL B-59395 TaxID=644548 RepID=F1YDX3_9ACTN|nr:mycofactocin-coupled SDR family oxidoreductase [Gordonia neofelifaecis]EGD57063.1 short-chain dehydrogenase/reductase SDR [Gordonia neofelifaecis NRRL B-59395]
MDLTGKVAWVTGAARGQGRSHALALAEAGAHVVVTDIGAPIDSVSYSLSSPNDLAETAREIKAAGGSVTAAQVDVRDRTSVNTLVSRIRDERGRLDILVANAGVCSFEPVESMTHQQWADMIDTNLTGTFNCAQAVLTLMKEHRFGRLIGISSGAGRGGMMHLSHYAASKWGIIGFIKSLALEVGAYGITANVVCPSSVGTPMVLNPATMKRFCPTVEHPTEDDLAQVFAGWSPLGVPWLAPEDVTRAVMYLIDDPGVVTGTVVEVNLGTTASRQ